MRNQLGIGVIGGGGRGALASNAHDPENGTRVVAVADTDPNVIASLEERYGEAVFGTEDYRRVLAREDVDCVFITTPDFLHEEHAVAALEAGKSVYLEKPMAITVEGCDRILETARRTGSKLFLGHNMRYFPAIIKMKEIIEAGTIGKLHAVWCRHFVSYGGDAYFKDWHSKCRFSNGMLLQKGAHDIDVIHWLSGGYSRRVVGMGRLSVYNRCSRRDASESPNPDWRIENWPPLDQNNLSPEIDIEDHSMILMELDNGVQASYMQCHYTPDACRNYTFIGDRGRIENFGDHGECRIEVYNKRTDKYGLPDQIHNLRPVAGSHGGADPVIVESFLQFVRDGTKPNTSPIAAREAVATGVAGTESLRSGGIPIVVDPVAEGISTYFEDR